ncbi:MAG: hypothetical protein LUC24_01115 [Bacteroidales bacterium]|nr:hypothetical protein [Bacteroidales bacterium]
MPQVEEFTELFSNSTVSIGSVGGVVYYQFISGINGNVLYIPVKSGINYWTGELYLDDTRQAYGIYFSGNVTSASGSYNRAYIDRNISCYIRPVYEHSKVFTLEADDIGGKSAELTGELSWYAYKNADSAGFYVSDSQSEIEAPDEQTRKVQAEIKTSSEVNKKLHWELNYQSISAVADELTRDNLYYYRAFVVIDGKEYLGEIESFTTLDAYDIGDFWPDDDDPEGVVFYVSNNGLNGKIVSLDQSKLVWQLGIPTYVSANNTDDGSRNTFPDGSPLWAWVSGHGDDWYCPAKNELKNILGSLAEVNKALKSIDSKSIEGFYWSSTQYSMSAYDLAYIVLLTESSTYMGYAAGWSSYNSKDQQNAVVAIKKF